MSDPFREALKTMPLRCRIAWRLPEIVMASFVGLVLATCPLSCSPGANRVVKTVLDILQIGCVLANAESEEPALQKVCSIADELLPDVRKIVASQRAASRKYAAEHAGACAPGVGDGGTGKDSAP